MVGTSHCCCCCFSSSCRRCCIVYIECLSVSLSHTHKLDPSRQSPQNTCKRPKINIDNEKNERCGPVYTPQNKTSRLRVVFDSEEKENLSPLPKSNVLTIQDDQRVWKTAEIRQPFSKWFRQERAATEEQIRLEFQGELDAKEAKDVLQKTVIDSQGTVVDSQGTLIASQRTLINTQSTMIELQDGVIALLKTKVSNLQTKYDAKHDENEDNKLSLSNSGPLENDNQYWRDECNQLRNYHKREMDKQEETVEELENEIEQKDDELDVQKQKIKQGEDDRRKTHCVRCRKVKNAMALPCKHIFCSRHMCACQTGAQGICPACGKPLESVVMIEFE